LVRARSIRLRPVLFFQLECLRSPRSTAYPTPPRFSWSVDALGPPPPLATPSARPPCVSPAGRDGRAGWFGRYQVTKDARRPHDTGIDHIFARCGPQSAAAGGAAAAGEARVYSDGKRCHLTDGVVFCQGGAPYVLGTDAACVARGSGWFHLPPVRVSDRAAARCGPAVPQRGIIV
jgi:hypothetical protein